MTPLDDLKRRVASNDLVPLSTAELNALIKCAEALKPFAAALDEWGDDHGQPDRWDVWEHPLSSNVVIGDFRAARTALSDLEASNV